MTDKQYEYISKLVHAKIEHPSASRKAKRDTPKMLILDVKNIIDNAHKITDATDPFIVATAIADIVETVCNTEFSE